MRVRAGRAEMRARACFEEALPPTGRLPRVADAVGIHRRVRLLALDTMTFCHI